ncbi:MAG: diguanylate cyclase, partial [Moraxellaceae bacterium]
VLRRPGDMAARYGGEEFVLLLPSTSLDGAREVALHVARSISALKIAHAASSVASHVTVSMGVASMVPRGDLRGPMLLARVDEAVYAAKHAGRNCIMLVLPDGTVDTTPVRLP